MSAKGAGAEPTGAEATGARSGGAGPAPGEAPFRAILFDAGNTLVFADRGRILELYRAEGVESDEERILRAELVARAQLASRVRDGIVGTEPHLWKEYFQTLFRESGVPEAALEAVGRRLVATHAKDHLWTHVEPGTTDALASLLEAGYRLAVISNADGRMESALERVGLRRHLEFVVDSGVVGFEKPDPRIFREGLQRLGLSPSEALYVGDLYPVDVVGARRVGMEAVLLDPSGVLTWPVPRIPSVLHLEAWLSRGSG
jgi:HAD superfamily hydrolase (TIGR01662 family)